MSYTRVKWCAGQWGREPSPAEALLIDVVCDALRTGPHNIRALKCGRIQPRGRGASIGHGDGTRAHVVDGGTPLCGRSAWSGLVAALDAPPCVVCQRAADREVTRD